MKKILALTSVLLLAASLSYAQQSATANLSVTVGAEAGITMGSTTAFASTPPFGNYTASTGLTYFIRTTSSGVGHITAEVTTDFQCGGGPCVATPINSADLLTYTSSGDQPGTTGTATYQASAVTASKASATPVVDFGASSQSLKAGNATSVAWNLVNDPAYKAGSYSAVVTFTISAT
jgi:hypothetical protein